MQKPALYLGTALGALGGFTLGLYTAFSVGLYGGLPDVPKVVLCAVIVSILALVLSPLVELKLWQRGAIVVLTFGAFGAIVRVLVH